MFEDRTITRLEMDGKTEEIPSGLALKELFTECRELFMANKGKDGRLKPDAPGEVKLRMYALKERLLKVHQEISRRRIKAFYDERFSKQPDIKSYDFTKVMKDVIISNMFKFGFRIGLDMLGDFMG